MPNTATAGFSPLWTLAQASESVLAPAPTSASPAPEAAATTPGAPVPSDTLLAPAGPSTTPAPGTIIAAPGAGATPPPSASPPSLMYPLLAVFAVFIIMQVMTGRRQKKQQEAKMAALKKGDRVLTIGGQIGIIDQIRDGEVVLRVDENSNAKARFTKTAIQQILETSPTSSADSPDPVVEVRSAGKGSAAVR